MKLYPKCHPYWVEDGEKIENPNMNGVAYTARGYLLPCCWCDNNRPETIKQFEYFGFYGDHMRLENNEVEDIVMSDEWYDFHNMLLFNPEFAPEYPCKKKCSDGLDIVSKGNRIYIKNV